MNIRDRIEHHIWSEMFHAKFWEQYISEYTGNRIDRRRYYNIAVISFAIIGSATWGIWRALNWELVTPIIFAVIGITQVLSAIQKEMIVDSNKLQSMYELRSKYILYLNKLERLHLKSNKDDISDEELESDYYSLRDTTPSIENLKDSLNFRDIKSVRKKASETASKYLNDRFKT